jgi:cysteine desulfurase/selenocysteine lyase
VRALDCDFLVFSGHKLYGPTGIGVLYGKKERLERLEPTTFGGGIVRDVTYERATWREIPQRFEAGTPNIAGAIGLGTAVHYLASLGWERITAHQQDLLHYFFEHKPDFIRCIGPSYQSARSSIISFVIDGIHPHDIAELLNAQKIAVRAGNHCAQPLMRALAVPGTVRISFGIYNQYADIDRLCAGLHRARLVFKKDH